jgi:subtilisin family serine protease
MKKLSFLFGVIVLVALFTSGSAQDFVHGQIMIDIKHEYLPLTPTPKGEDIIITGLPSIDSLNALYEVYAFEKLANDSLGVSKGFYLLKFPDSLDVNQVLSSYLADIHVNMGSLNYIRETHGITPSDYYYPEQWGLRKMECPGAWKYSLGSSSIIIQIIDGGTDYGHPDLVRNIWQNLGEDSDGDGHTIEWDPAQNRWVLDPGDFHFYPTDDDFNGYPDDLVGFDFLSWDGDPDCHDSPYPWLDHGDLTAGTAAAMTDNWISLDEAEWICYHWSADTSVVGTSWFSKIMIARFLGEDAHAINAIHYGMMEGAKIISMSWGSPNHNAMLQAKLDQAWGYGLLLIASAGNSYGEDILYPAAYENVIAVAATDTFDVKTDYSTYGTWVDICAPGSNKSPDRDNKWWDYYCYENWGGTSCSAPFVSGVAALVWTCYPESSNVAIRNALINSADDIYGIPENYPYIGKLGSGRANAYNAVRYYGAQPRPSGDCTGDGVVDVSDAVFLTAYLFQDGPPPNPLCIADTNDDGEVNIADAVCLVVYFFQGGPAPMDGCD